MSPYRLTFHSPLRPGAVSVNTEPLGFDSCYGHLTEKLQALSAGAECLNNSAGTLGTQRRHFMYTLYVDQLAGVDMGVED